MIKFTTFPICEHFLSDFRAIEEFFKDHAREISTYAQGEVSKGDIVEHGWTRRGIADLRSRKELLRFSQHDDQLFWRFNSGIWLSKLQQHGGGVLIPIRLSEFGTSLEKPERPTGLMGGLAESCVRLWVSTRVVVGVTGGHLVQDQTAAFRLLEQLPEDWDFEIEIRPQLFGLMEAEFWEPKAVEPLPRLV